MSLWTFTKPAHPSPEDRLKDLVDGFDTTLVSEDVLQAHIIGHIKEAVAQEREACAKLVEEHPKWYCRADRGKLADAIRNR